MPPKKRARTTAPVPKLYEVLFPPHILEAVLNELPHSSLLALRTVSKIWREPIDAMFLRHVIIDETLWGRKRCWTAKSPLGRIPLKKWHTKQELIDQVWYLDLRCRSPPPWVKKIPNLKSFRFQCTSFAAPFVINLSPFSTLHFRNDYLSPYFYQHITVDEDDPEHLVVGIRDDMHRMPKFRVLPQKCTFIVLPPLGSGKHQRKEILLRRLVDTVLAVFAEVEQGRRCRIILCGLEKWFQMPPNLDLTNQDDEGITPSPEDAINDCQQFEDRIRQGVGQLPKLETWERPAKAAKVDDLLGMLDYITLDDYRAKVGKEQFKFETELAMET